MKRKRFRFYTLVLMAGFLVIMAIEAVFYLRFQTMNEEQSDFIKKSYNNYIENLNLTHLANMTRYIEKEYPVLHDTERLKREAGTDWYWALAEEFHEIAQNFNFAYIYYMEKVDGVYRFLLSSGIRQDEHPEWLGTPVWQGDPPAFVDEAYESKQLVLTPEPVVNEWGALIEAALPIVTDGVVVGILGVDYDVAGMAEIKQQEDRLNEQKNALLRTMRLAFIISCVFIGIIMFIQILIGFKSVLVPIQSLVADEYTKVIVDTIPMSCSLWDQSGKLIFDNAASLELYDSPVRPASLDDFLSHCPALQPDGADSRAFAMEKIKTAFETGYEHFEWMYQTASGEPLPVETSMVRIVWKDKPILAIYSRGLREIKAKEAAALELEKRMRVMLDTMVFACFFFDMEGKPIDCNRRALSLYGCHDKKEFLDNFFDFSPEYQDDGQRSRDKAMHLIREAFETGKIIFRWEHLKANGTPLPAEITLVRVEWEEGYRIVAYARDLTSLMETEDNLRRILSVVENSPNFTFYISADGDIEYMNPAVSSLTGFSQQELLSDGLEQIFSPEDFQRLGTEYFTAALEKHIVHFEMGVLDRHGRRREFSFSAFAAKLYGRKNGIGILGRDITVLKQTQQDLLAAKEQAERALAEEMRYNKAKSDFLSRISHELRTPINAIMGMTALVKKASGKNEDIEKIEAASEHLLSIVNDILDMTGFDTGSFEFTARPFSFSRAMDSIIDAIRARVKEKGQTFVTAIGSTIPANVNSDEKRLKQLLMNLLSNAVKFTPEKGTIGFSAGLLEQGENWCRVRFEISDNGIGIDEETCRRLWDTFEQADNSITRRFGGLGLGLPLAKRIIDLLDGEIRIESEPGKGSRFICDVRLDLDQTENEPKLKAEPGAEESTGVLDLSKRRILVVDDVELNRAILISFLEDSGAVLDEAEDGAKAIRMFSENKYDMVFMDIHMPVMDGFSAARGIRASALPWAKKIPIISISADSNTLIHAQCLEAGINACLAKPVDFTELFEIVKKWLPQQ
jgi:PAS domain S-box-containing protein